MLHVKKINQINDVNKRLLLRGFQKNEYYRLSNKYIQFSPSVKGSSVACIWIKTDVKIDFTNLKIIKGRTHNLAIMPKYITIFFSPKQI